jgi:hypothetical protein
MEPTGDSDGSKWGVCLLSDTGVLVDTLAFGGEAEVVWDWRADVFFETERLPSESTLDVELMRCTCYAGDGELLWVRDISSATPFPSPSGSLFVSATGWFDPMSGPKPKSQFVTRDGVVVTVPGLHAHSRSVLWEGDGKMCRIKASTAASKRPPLSFVDPRKPGLDSRLLCYSDAGEFVWENRVNSRQMRSPTWGKGIIACLPFELRDGRVPATSIRVYDDTGEYLWERYTGEEPMSVYRHAVSPDGSVVWCIAVDYPPHLYEEARLHPRLQCFDARTADSLVDIELPVDTSSGLDGWPRGVSGAPLAVSSDGDRVCVILRDGAVLLASQDGRVLHRGLTAVTNPRRAVWLDSDVLMIRANDALALYELPGDAK